MRAKERQGFGSAVLVLVAAVCVSVSACSQGTSAAARGPAATERRGARSATPPPLPTASLPPYLVGLGVHDWVVSLPNECAPRPDEVIYLEDVAPPPPRPGVRQPAPTVWTLFDFGDLTQCATRSATFSVVVLATRTADPQAHPVPGRQCTGLVFGAPQDCSGRLDGHEVVIVRGEPRPVLIESEWRSWVEQSYQGPLSHDIPVPGGVSTGRPELPCGTATPGLRFRFCWVPTTLSESGEVDALSLAVFAEDGERSDVAGVEDFALLRLEHGYALVVRPVGEPGSLMVHELDDSGHVVQVTHWRGPSVYLDIEVEGPC